MILYVVFIRRSCGLCVFFCSFVPAGVIYLALWWQKDAINTHYLGRIQRNAGWRMASCKPY